MSSNESRLTSNPLFFPKAFHPAIARSVTQTRVKNPVPRIQSAVPTKLESVIPKPLAVTIRLSRLLTLIFVNETGRELILACGSLGRAADAIEPSWNSVNVGFPIIKIREICVQVGG